jgi:formate/nitrite transporter
MSQSSRKDYSALPPQSTYDHIKLYKSPAEVVSAIAVIAETKTQIKWYKLIIMGVMAGFFLGFGGTLSLRVAAGVNPEFYKLNPSMPGLIVGLFFPVGLCLVILIGSDLFTGNTMYFIIGIFQGRTTIYDLLFNWIISMLANYAGCVLYALLAYGMGTFSDPQYLTFIINWGSYKIYDDWYVLFLKAIACNMLVCFACYISIAAEDVGSKILGIWICISTFIASGYEHSIANIFFIHLSIIYGADIHYFDWLFKNFFPVTLGNIVGGSILVGAIYGFLYTDNIQFASKEKSIE